jgi:glycosyltransferase involved in cell wall biosynthesis
MRVTVIGPAFPWRGGIPLLVTDLAYRLAGAGHSVRLHTWSSQGPARLLPVQRHRLVAPEARTFPTDPEPLSWWNPLHWWRVGRRSGRTSDTVILIFYTTVQAPALWAIVRSARRHARVLVICANAVQHEPRPGDRLLTALLMDAADGVLVHTEAERAALAALTSRPIATAALPPHLPAGVPGRPGIVADGPVRNLLFFGKVRHYKGVDVLLRALVELPGVGLTVVGEFYDDVAGLRALVDDLGLASRVGIRPGYLPADRIGEVFAAADALVLPYRTATASQHVALAHRHGIPAVATRVGNFPAVLRNGFDGLLCAPDDVDDLVRALRELYEPGRLAALRAAIRPVDAEADWRAYLTAIEELVRGERPGVTGRRSRGG